MNLYEKLIDFTSVIVGIIIVVIAVITIFIMGCIGIWTSFYDLYYFIINIIIII